MMKNELSVWKCEALISSHAYKITTIASRIKTSHNSQSRCGGLSLQEFSLIRMKNKPQHTSLHVFLARTRSYIYSPASHWQGRLGLQWLVGGNEAGAREGCPSLSMCCPKPKPTDKCDTATTGPHLRYFVDAGCFEHLRLCRHCANVKDKKEDLGTTFTISLYCSKAFREGNSSLLFTISRGQFMATTTLPLLSSL